MSTPAKLPDWFDLLWEERKDSLPILFRGESAKQLARNLLNIAVEGAARQAATPQGVRAIIAFSRIAAIVKGAHGVCDAPDPSPEQVADAIERLVKKVKP
jgi:hypothetical protein